ncbi:hypothetical protein V8E54_006985 [Elaphomyces granulatus]
MLDANTSSGPDHERPGLEKETSEPPHGKLEKADPGPVSACTANIGDRKSSPSREGRPTTREDGRGRDFQSDRVKSMRRQSLLSVALENPFERLPLQPFPSYAANGKFLLHSRPSPPICLLLTCISQSAQSLHCPFLQNPRQAFLKSLLPPIHIPLDMIGIKAMITQQGATRDNRPSQERLPPRPFPSYATNGKFLLHSRPLLLICPLLICISQSAQSLHSPILQNETTAPTESLPLPDMVGTEIKDSDQAFLKSLLPPNHIPLDMVGIKATKEPNVITDTEVKGSDLALTFSMPTVSSYSIHSLPILDHRSLSVYNCVLSHSRPSQPICPFLTYISQLAQSLHSPFLQNGFFEITAPTESLPVGHGTEVKDSDQVRSYFFYANAKFLLLSLPPLSAGHGRHQSNDHPGTEVNTGPSQPMLT